MTSSAFNVGRDCQIVLMGPFGRIDLTHVTGFEARQLTAPIRVDRIDGTQIAADLPKGWEGGFDIERGNSAVDDFIAQIEATFVNGSSVPTGTLYQYVNEVNGSTSTYQFNAVVFKLTQAGIWKGDQSVKQRLDFFASTRVRV